MERSRVTIVRSSWLSRGWVLSGVSLLWALYVPTEKRVDLLRWGSKWPEVPSSASSWVVCLGLTGLGLVVAFSLGRGTGEGVGCGREMVGGATRHVAQDPSMELSEQESVSSVFWGW